MIYAYIQESQLKSIQKYNYDKIILESSNDRKITDLISKLREGDTLIVSDLESFGARILKSIKQMQQAGVNIVIDSLNIDTRTAAGKLAIDTLIKVSELQREKILEKRRIGRENSRKRGVHQGRPRTWEKEQMEEAIYQYQNTDKKVDEIIEDTRVSRASFYRVLSEKGINTRYKIC